jgi:hypothetical protein
VSFLHDMDRVAGGFLRAGSLGSYQPHPNGGSDNLPAVKASQNTLPAQSASQGMLRRSRAARETRAKLIAQLQEQEATVIKALHATKLSAQMRARAQEMLSESQAAILAVQQSLPPEEAAALLPSTYRNLDDGANAQAKFLDIAERKLAELIEADVSPDTKPRPGFWDWVTGA